MSLKKNDNDQSRICNLDFLRGFFIILALQQHFTYYINMWYVEYFKDAMALTSTFSIHFSMIGKQIACDSITYWMAKIFTPWVSQIYLTMAAFNLAKYDQLTFAKKIENKYKVFSLIFLYFIVENFIVAPNMGQAISFYPIMLWMFVLSIISALYHFLGIRGVLVLGLISLLRFIVPVELISDFFEEVIRATIHPGYEYDARLEYFIFSGILGFLMGYVHYHLPNYKIMKDFYFISLGLVMVAIYIAIGDPFVIYPDDIFRTEHDLAKTFSGTAYILGIQAIVISVFLWLERKQFRISLPVINWIGINSLLIFALHRILFVRLIAPISVTIGSITGRVLTANVLEIYTYILITLLICYFIKKSPISEIILQKKSQG